MLLMVLIGAHALYVPISRPAETRLHELGRSAIRQGNHDRACFCYSIAAAHGSEARSHLLLALHLQRCGRASDAREAFRIGVQCDRNSGQLLQAWALFESRQGEMQRAVHLLRRAVRVDRSVMGALRWWAFRNYNRHNNPLARPPCRGRTLASHANKQNDFGI